jgi:tetratricopeptide (TPR) repeat protein
MKTSLLRLLLLALPFFAVGGAPAATFPELVAKGDALDAQLNTAEALAIYLDAEKLNPDNAELLIKIAKQHGESMVDLKSEAAQLAAGQQALGYARRALALAPDLADAHLAVAICYGRLLNLVPAREKVEYSRLVKEHTERAIALDRRSDYAWHMLGRWHRAVADTGALLKGVVRVVYGGLPSASHRDAVAAFEKAGALRPDRLAHHIELGLTYASMGEADKARESIKRGLSLPDRERDDPDTKARGRALLGTLGN